MWTEKHRPLSVADVVGNEQAKLEFIRWLDRWKIGDKAALLHGPPGVGKTALVEAAAKERGYNLIEMNASDARTETAITRIIGRAAGETSLDATAEEAGKNLIFLDEVDGLSGREDQGGVGAIIDIIGRSRFPVVLAANNASEPKLRSLREHCITIRFYEIRPPLIVALLQNVCRLEGLSVDSDVLKKIASSSSGDLRAALNDLQRLAQGRMHLTKRDIPFVSERDRNLDVARTLQQIFESSDLAKALALQRSSQIDYETLHLLIHDNLPSVKRDPLELSEAYDRLSQADVLFGRIRGENWGLLGYAIELMLSSALSERPRRATIPALRLIPSKFLRLAKTRSEREVLETISAKVGESCHTSRAIARRDILPYLKIILENGGDVAREISTYLGLDEEMVGYLGGREGEIEG
jgi:replication factor C large subunit